MVSNRVGNASEADIERGIAFRGRRGNRFKLLTWDGQGFCLHYKVLEKVAFPGRRPRTARLPSARLLMLWEGID